MPRKDCDVTVLRSQTLTNGSILAEVHSGTLLPIPPVSAVRAAAEMMKMTDEILPDTRLGDEVTSGEYKSQGNEKCGVAKHGCLQNLIVV